ncbi:hypothetical protein HK101_002419 [Irineochytrium annulatum]|nr:hypothetical protein HK101_002419 [Irineochytrium annulatum]
MRLSPTPAAPLRSLEDHSIAVYNALPTAVNPENELVTDLSWYKAKKYSALVDSHLQVHLLHRPFLALETDDEILVDLGARRRREETGDATEHEVGDFRVDEFGENGGLDEIEFVSAVMTKFAALGVCKYYPDRKVVPIAWKVMDAQTCLPVEFALLTTPAEHQLVDSVMTSFALSDFVKEFSDLLNNRNLRSLFGLRIQLPTRPAATTLADSRRGPITYYRPADRLTITRYEPHTTVNASPGALVTSPTNEKPCGQDASASSREFQAGEASGSTAVGEWAATLPPPMYGADGREGLDVEEVKGFKEDAGTRTFSVSFGSLDVDVRLADKLQRARRIKINAVASSVRLHVADCGLRVEDEPLIVDLNMLGSSLVIVAGREQIIEKRFAIFLSSASETRQATNPLRGAPRGPSIVFIGTTAMSDVLIEEPFVSRSPRQPLNPAFDPLENIKNPPSILKSGEERRLCLRVGRLQLKYKPVDLLPRRWMIEAVAGVVDMDLASGCVQSGTTVLVVKLMAAALIIKVPAYMSVSWDEMTESGMSMCVLNDDRPPVPDDTGYKLVIIGRLVKGVLAFILQHTILDGRTRAANYALAREAEILTSSLDALVLRIVELSGSDATANEKKAKMATAIRALHECDDRVKKAEDHLAHSLAACEKGAFLKSAKDKLAAAVETAQMQLDGLRAQRQVYIQQEQSAIYEHSRVAPQADELASARSRVSLIMRQLFDTVYVPQNASLERELIFFIGRLCRFVNEIVSVHKASSALKDASDLITVVDDDAALWARSADVSMQTVLRHARNYDTVNLIILKACALVPDLIIDVLPPDIATNSITTNDFGNIKVRTFDFLPPAIDWLTLRSRQLNVMANKVVTRMVAVAKSLHDFRVAFIEGARPHAREIGGARAVSATVLPVVMADVVAVVQTTVKDRLALKEAQVAKLLSLSRTFEDEEEFYIF